MLSHYSRAVSDHLIKCVIDSEAPRALHLKTPESPWDVKLVEVEYGSWIRTYPGNESLVEGPRKDSVSIRAHQVGSVEFTTNSNNAIRIRQQWIDEMNQRR